MLDLIIIGAGPAGLASAREARERGLDFLVLERGLIADTISQFPIGKLLFSTPGEIELAPHTLICRAEKPTREELLTHYARFAVDAHFPIHTHEPVASIERDPEGFIVTTPRDCYRSRAVLVATGINGIHKRLNVPGETPTRVKYQFSEAYAYAGQDVLVAGSGNSAAEVAMFLEEVSAHVTLAMRRQTLLADSSTGKAEIKWWVREPLNALVEAGRIRLLLATRISSLGEDVARLDSAEFGPLEIPCQTVFALLGTRPDLGILAGADVEIDAAGVPVYNPETMETNVPGLYVAGHLTREKHIKGAMQTAPRVIEQISRSLALT